MSDPKGNRLMKMSEDLTRILDRFSDATLVVVGDIILDHYIWGTVERISPEAPVVVVDTTDEDKRLGGAGNVVHNLVTLGASVSVLGVVGDDERGALVRKLFEDQGVDASGVVVDPSRQTSVKTRVIANSQQVVRVDRESRDAISSTQVDELLGSLSTSLPTSSALIVSDYAKGVVTPALFEELSRVHERGEFGLQKRPLIVDPKGPNFDVYQYATVIKPNRVEAQQASGVAITDRKSALVAAEKLLSRWKTDLVLITLGEHGMVVLDREGNSEEIETLAQEVFDVSGAGDTVSAVFSLALAVGATPAQAAQLSNMAAGIVVREIGAVPISLEQLRAAVHTHAQSKGS